MSGTAPQLKPKASLQSLLLRNDPRLTACLKIPEQHILRGNAGAHVTKVQTALLAAVPGASIAAAELPNPQAGRAHGLFGSTTEALVFRFKSEHKPPILGPNQKTPDRIVGQLTISCLDDVLMKLADPTVPLADVLRLLEGVKHRYLDLGLRDVLGHQAITRGGFRR